jgi:hypothetical protein
MGQEEFNQTKDRIGNLTILEKRLNLEARDKPFEQKKDKYQASDYEMAQSITDYDRWSADVISSRTEELVDAATRIWDFDV